MGHERTTSLLFALAAVVVFGACGASRGYSGSSTRAMTRAAKAPLLAKEVAVVPGEMSSKMTEVSEELVIEGSLRLEVEDVGLSTKAIAEMVRNAGGRVIREEGSGAGVSWSGYIKVRVPPSGVSDLLQWCAKHGDILSKNISAEDVSKELFDQELALENLNKTMERLQALLDRPDLDVEAVLKIEKEMTRVRGEIEAIKGAQRYLKDRVAYATLEIHLSRRAGAVRRSKTKFFPAVRVAALRLLDPQGRQATRLGAGVGVYLPGIHMSYELDVFEGPDGEKRGILATMGGATYSDHLGGGRRAFLNPYLGLRMGYGRLDGSNFVLAADAGVELYKHEAVMLDLNIRTTAFFGEGGPEMALVPGASFSFAF